MKAIPVVAISLIATLLILAHVFLVHTAALYLPSSWMGPLALLVYALSVTFPLGTLTAFRLQGPLVRALYWVAALWLGALNYLFWAALGLRLTGWMLPMAARPWLAGGLLGAVVAILAYGFVNARQIHVRRYDVRLRRLPERWNGRNILLLSDLHLGNLNREGFAQRIVELANGLKPEMVAIAGDLFDGALVDADRLLAPFRELKAPHGVWFASGNHDEFGPHAAWLKSIEKAGIGVLDRRMEMVDGLPVIGIDYGLSTDPLRLRQFLEGLELGQRPASLLLNHVPNRLPIVEQAGVGLQVSGHTHGGQFAPYTWITRRIFGAFVHGLSRHGSLQVATSTGCGSWGPPIRVGTEAEVVMLRLVAEE